jgi:hypothetical protein
MHAAHRAPQWRHLASGVKRSSSQNAHVICAMAKLALCKSVLQELSLQLMHFEHAVHCEPTFLHDIQLTVGQLL